MEVPLGGARVNVSHPLPIVTGMAGFGCARARMLKVRRVKTRRSIVVLWVEDEKFCKAKKVFWRQTDQNNREWNNPPIGVFEGNFHCFSQPFARMKQSKNGACSKFWKNETHSLIPRERKIKVNIVWMSQLFLFVLSLVVCGSFAKSAWKLQIWWANQMRNSKTEKLKKEIVWKKLRSWRRRTRQFFLEVWLCPPIWCFNVWNICRKEVFSISKLACLRTGSSESDFD